MKRAISYTLFFVALLLVGIGIGWIAYAEEVLWTNKTGVGWIAPITNEDGTPFDDLSHYEVGISTPETDPNTGGPVLQRERVECLDEECKMVLEAIRQTIADGKYKPWVRVVDTAGNTSVWAGTEDTLKKDTKPPSRVTKVRIIADVTIETVP